MIGIQIRKGISETVFPAGRFVWKMRNGHALAMMTGPTFAKISLPRRHDLALPHRRVVAHLAAVQQTAMTALGREPSGKMRKSSITRGRHD
jgi:hypothetical protein